jgi:RNA polymerase sigma factor (sigma-70 family)
MSDDANLLRRYAENRSEADFTAWVQRHFDLVYSAALRQLQGDHHRARDVAQTVFVDAARKAGSLCRHPAVVGWLYTSAHFAAQKMIRSESRRQVREDAHATEHASSPGGEPWEELRPYLDAEMLALGSADRAAILLRFFDERPLAEVGAELGLSENAARMRVERALAKLRQRLARRGVASSAAALAAALSGHAVMAAPAGLGAVVAGNSLLEIASVTAGSAGGTAILAPLMASKLTIGIVAACGLLALGSGVYYREQAQASGPWRLALERACTQLEAALQGLPEERAREAARIASLKTAPPAAGGGPAMAAPDPLLSSALEAELAENPQLRLAFAKSFLNDYRAHYGSLAEQLGWSAAQMDQAGRLELKLRSDFFDLEHAARLMGKDPATDAAVRSMEQQLQQASEAAVAGVIGQDGLGQQQEYDRSFAARDIASQVAAGSFYGAAPLGPAQADALTHLLMNGSAAFQQGGKLEPDTIDWDGVLAQATGVLPAPQVAALRAYHADWERRNLADAAETAAAATP